MGLILPNENDLRSFVSQIDFLKSGCWYWTGARSRGSGNKKWYPSFWVPSLKTTVRGHRYSSEVFNCEECPPGYHRDHTCCFSMCVCPEHIEVVTREINQSRKRIMNKHEHFSLLLSRFGIQLP